MSKVLITGGAGLIGRRIVVELCRLGYDVSIYDNLQMGSIDEFKPIKDKLDIYNGDIRNYKKLSSAVSRCDQVLHLAAPSSMIMYLETPIESTLVTYQGFLNLIEAMRRHNVNKLVFASTSAVYEGLPVPWREDMVVFPPDLKALSKLQNEEVAHLYANRYGITSVAVRPLSVYGTGEYTKKGYANIISLFVWAILNGNRPIIWGDGTQTRDFIHVDDAAKLFVRIIEWNKFNQEEGGFEVFNLGTGIETSFNEIVMIINELLGTEYEPIYTPVPIDVYSKRILADMEKVRKILGWCHSISVRKGIQMTIDEASKSGNKSLSKHQEYALSIQN